MRRFLQFAFLLALLTTITSPSWGQAPIISPTNPAVNGGSSTQQFTCTSNCGSPTTGWTCTSCAGSINSGTGLYTSPASVTAKNQLAGYQFLPNNHVFNTDISALTGSAVGGGASACCYNLIPSFPINYCTNSSPTDSMVFFYTPTHNGTYCAPTQNSGLSGNIESGWYQARNLVPGVTPNGADHHYLKANSSTGGYEDQYQYYFVGNGTAEGCALCNSQSGVKYSSNDYAAPTIATDAAGMFLMPLMLRRQEFDTACAGGAGTGTINHALRVTLNPGGITNNGFIWPAVTGASGSGSNPEGTRFRLKSSFSEVGYSACAKLILHLLKNYGLILADAGFSWQSNIEYAAWSETDVGYFAEVNNANIPSSQFEVVDESSLVITSSSLEANTSRETVCYVATTGTTCTDIVLVGVTVGMLQDVVDIMAGAPNFQFNAGVHGSSNSSLTWTLSSAVGSINSSTGAYTPPATLTTQTTITVTATSVANSAVSASTILRVWPHVSAYALPGWTTGHDFTDVGGKSWRSGAGIGVTSQQGQIGCCADLSASYTGSSTDNELWDHVFTGSLTNLVDNHIYWFVPAGTYTLTFHSIAVAAAGANTSNVNFISQGSTLATNVDFAGGGVNQYGAYTRTDSSITVTCNNLLTYDEQTYDAGGFEQVSSFSIVQNTNTQASCSAGVTGGAGAGMMR